MIHTCTCWFVHIHILHVQTRSPFNPLWFHMVWVWPGSSCIMALPLECWGRSFSHLLSWIWPILIKSHFWGGALWFSTLKFLLIPPLGTLVYLPPLWLWFFPSLSFLVYNHKRIVRTWISCCMGLHASEWISWSLCLGLLFLNPSLVCQIRWMTTLPTPILSLGLKWGVYIP